MLTHKISFRREHLSIKTFQEIGLPNFTLITGLNGAGKSHLLDAINQGALFSDAALDHITPHPLAPVRLYDWLNLTPKDTGTHRNEDVRATKKRQIWSNLEKATRGHPFRDNLDREIRPFNLPAEFGEAFTLLRRKEAEIKNFLGPDQFLVFCERYKNALYDFEKNHASNMIDPQSKFFLGLLAKQKSCSIMSIEEQDIMESDILLWEHSDPFGQSFTRMFVEYRQLQITNDFQKVKNDREISSRPSLSDDDFESRYGSPPWDEMNDVFERSNLDFKINNPPYEIDIIYEPKLTKKSTNTEISFNALSSGEKILISLAFSVYFNSDRRNNVKTPKVLLFDEIDAPLHPSMTRNLINIIQEVLIGKYGIKVIMTTHSPSTVALAPEDSIYTMRSGKSGLHPTKKGEALNILTAGIPTLAISYEGRRQVFVESSNDARIYEKIYSLIREKLNSERSLSFIEPGVKKKDKTSVITDSTDVGTGCAIVKKIVRQMDSYGNTSTYGLVDWDGRNTPAGRVMVFAQEEFYTLENGLLDPLLIGLLLVRACKSHTTDIGIGENESYLQIINSPKDRMQKIADQVALKIFINAPKSKVTKKYLGNLEIEIDERASSKKGHCYETEVIKAFPCLLKIQNHREGKLMDEIIHNVLLDNPDLTPKAFADAFLKILNHNSHAD